MHEFFGDIPLFVEVGKHLSFLKAAQSLGISTSTLSRRIQLLEKRIGIQLFNRNTRHVELTSVGQVYYLRCAELVQSARTAHEQLDDLVLNPSGTLRFTCTQDFAIFFLPNILQDFQHQYPAINIEMEMSSRKVDLFVESFDFALRIGKQPDSNLVTKPIASFQAALYAAPTYLQKMGTPKTPEDLPQHRCVALFAENGMSYWQLHHRQATNQNQEVATKQSQTTHKLQLHCPLVANSYIMIRELICLGAGIGLIDSTIAKPEVERGRLQQILTEWLPEPVTVQMITTSRLQPAKVRLFSDFLKEKLKMVVA